MIKDIFKKQIMLGSSLAKELELDFDLRRYQLCYVFFTNDKDIFKKQDNARVQSGKRV
jgi:hypothetical protein